jgi:acyl transferase domain-containing protein/NADPH:quinone reductase-like Zn-dependent oxidoreductase/NAD(P)-dependent dehydrogenase (short-subunit alcohol dehydrogenase family)
LKPETDLIAIVGIGCRLPGQVAHPAALWEFLQAGGDASGEVPADRWDPSAFYDPSGERPNTVYTRRGSFLEGHDLFDPEFFGYSPREAQMMDPQQRLLLETTWEALEDAGHQPSRWAHRAVGVFVGMFTHDFEILRGRLSETPSINPYSATGGSATIAANRLSHVFDFTGPSMVIDTACSSSLVAVHQACRSLLSGEAEMALAGGVNLQLLPETVVGLSKARMLAPDGRCKSFDARADGYARADGVAMVVLRRLSDALRDGDRVYAVIHGSAVNQDGRTPTITMPNAEAQMGAIRSALQNAGLSAADISYVEAHGTGTPTGDPVEARALGAVIGAAQPEGQSCVIGSIKSNIGHTESTAGVAGLIKVALMLQRGQILPNIHFETPNPDIPFADLRLRVPTAPEPWVAPPQGRFAGVNSFGFGGTNAHVVLGEAPPCDAEPALGSSGPWLLCLSARSDESLRAQAARHAEALRTRAPEDLSLDTLAGALALEREHHPKRLAVRADSRDAAIAALGIAAEGGAGAGLVRGSASAEGKLAFVFSGMGQQHWAMGRSLRRWNPVFARKLEEIDALFARHTTEWSLLQELGAAEDLSRIDRTDIAQPAIFAVQVGLAAMWQAFGVVPDVVSGHSVGEVAAAHVAGALTLEQAVAVSFHRSRLQALTAGQGRMLAVGLPEAEVAERIAAHAGRVCIAAVNSPRSVTLAGDAAVLARLEPLFTAEGAFARMLNVEVPYHSPAMDAITDDLRAALGAIRGQSGTIPMISTVTGTAIDGSRIDADYWVRNVRDPVRFLDAMDSMTRDGVRTFVELGAHPVLSSAMRECLSRSEGGAAVLASQRRGQEDAAVFLDAAGALFCQGYPVDFGTLYARPLRPPHLPGYAWDHRRIWQETAVSAQQRLRRMADGSAVHPLLGPREDSAEPRWRGYVTLSGPAFLQDHKVRDAVLFPAAGFIEMALAGVARAAFGSIGDGQRPVAIGDFRIERPLVLDPKQRAHLQLTLEADGNLSIHARPSEDDQRGWTRHATGRILPDAAIGAAAPALDLDAVRDRLAAYASDIYPALARKGLQYGPAFANLRGVWLGTDEALGHIVAGPEIAADFSDAGRPYHLHPALLDSCLHPLALMPGEGTYLPSGCGEVTVHAAAPAGSEFWVHLRITARGGARITADINLFTPEGNPVARLRDFSFRLFEAAGEAQDTGIPRQFRQAWIAAPMSGPAPSLPKPAALAAAMVANDGPARRLAGAALDRLAQRLLVDALDIQGHDWRVKPADTSALAHEAAIAPDREGAFATLLQAMAGADTAELAPAAEQFRAALDAYPECGAELAALWHVGQHLPAFLRRPEAASPLPLALAEPLAAEARSASIGVQTLTAAIGALLAALPAGADLRVLHLGSGNGAVLARLLPLLPPDRCSLLAIDPPEATADWLLPSLPAYPFLRHQVLDVLTHDADAVLGDAAFDLIVVEAGSLSAEVQGVLDARLHRALTPGGVLLQLGPRNLRSMWQALLDVFTGTANPPDHTALLTAAGFDTAVPLPTGEADSLSRTAVLACQRASGSINAGTPDDAGLTLMLDNGDALAVAVVAMLEKQGITPLRLSDADLNADILGPLLDALPQGVVASVLDLRAPQRGPEDAINPAERALVLCRDLRGAALAFIDAAGAQGLRYWVVTQDAQATGETAGAGLDQAPLWGFARSLANEEPTLDLRLVDISPDLGEAELLNLARLVRSPDAEQEMALRGPRRLVRRLANDANLHRLDGSDGGFRLKRRRRRPPADMLVESLPFTPPLPGEVLLRLDAVGLNYKDSVITAGLLDNSPHVDTGNIGFEGAGVVLAVGEGVQGLVPGDAVFGLINGISFPASTRADFLIRKPADLSYGEVAGLSVVMASAWHALTRLGRLQAGETLLIHSATSALGMAAIQIARHLGARVLATAGEGYKRAWLQGMGVEVIGASRNASFTEGALKATGGKGVDVILSPLPSSLLPANLAALRPTTGRLVDVANIHYDVPLNMRSLVQGITVSGFDLMRIVELSPDYMASLLAELAPLIASGVLRPLPFRMIPMARGFDALRSQLTGGHIGKNILDMAGGVLSVTPVPDAPALDATGSYLISGGLSGLGLALAQRLAGAGAQHLVLLGRRGAATPEAPPVLATLRARGVTVVDLACDVSDPAQVQTLVARFGHDLPPLRGVIHAAGLSQDIAVRDMTDEQLRAVMSPKAQGAWNLHSASLGHNLGFFVGITSFANVIGNLGQANYNAANEFLDALIAHRRASGLPGLTLALGVIADLGFVARDAALRANVQRTIAGEISVDEIWLQLCRGLQDGLAQVCYAQFDWSRAGRVSRSIQRSPRFAPLAALIHKAAGTDRQADDDAAGADLSPAGRRSRLSAIVRAEVARVLGMPADKLTDATQLVDQGFDSLISTELILALEISVGVTLRQGALMRADLTIGMLVEELETLLGESPEQDGDPAPVAASVPTPPALPAETPAAIRIDDLSDAEVDALLAQIEAESPSNG